MPHCNGGAWMQRQVGAFHSNPESSLSDHLFFLRAYAQARLYGPARVLSVNRPYSA